MTYDPNYNNGQPNYQNQPGYNQQSVRVTASNGQNITTKVFPGRKKTWRYSHTSHRFSPCCCH